MAKTFHGKIDETVDALIIIEACRQGVLPRISRRLLAAERGEVRPNPEGIPSSNHSASSSSSTRQSLKPSAVSVSSATASSPSSLISISASATSSPSSSSSTGRNTQVPTSSSSSSTSLVSSATANPSLIIPGSVFVFDEEESGIHRWTDGKIWSPSRICGNFLIYRELYRKLPDQKCYTTSEKALMKDGTGLKDQKLREKVDKENLVVMGCMKGTFVLKNGGLIKKTICVKGVNLVPAEELKKQLERSSSSSSRRGGRGSGRSKVAGHDLLPGFSTRSAQHLVCYERPGEMSDLYGPRDYLELRNLPISKTFVMMQTYRIPINIEPLKYGQMPLDPADEYIHSSRVVEARSTKALVTDPFDTTNTTTPTKRRAVTRRQTQGQKHEGAGGDTFESENEGFNYLVDDDYSSESDYDTEISNSRPPHSRAQAPIASVTRVIRHNYSTRSQNRLLREQVHQQLLPWSPSRQHFVSEPLTNRKRRAAPPERADEESPLIKVEQGNPSLNVPYPVGYSSGRNFQHNNQAQRSQFPMILRPPPNARNNSEQIQDFLDSMSNKSSPFNQGDDNCTVHGYKSTGGYWYIASSSSRRSPPSSDIIGPLPQHEGGAYMTGFGRPPPFMDVQSYSQNPSHWQVMNLSRQQQQHHHQQQPWNYDGSYNQVHERRIIPDPYSAQQHQIAYHGHFPLSHSTELQFQSHPRQQGFSGDTSMSSDSAPASAATLTSMQSFQSVYEHPAGADKCGYAPSQSPTVTSVEEYGQGSLPDSPVPLATVSDGQRMSHSAMGFSDSDCSPLRQRLQKEHSSGSLRSTPSINSRESSLSSSLTLSPIIQSLTQPSQSTGSPVECDSAPQLKVGTFYANEKGQVENVCQSSTHNNLNLEQPKGSMVIRHQTKQPLSGSFTHNTRTLSSSYQTSVSTVTHLSMTTMTIPANSDVATMPVDETSHLPHLVTPHDSTMELIPSASSDHAMDRAREDEQEQGQSVHQPLRQPYVPMMNFSPRTVLGAGADYSPQGSPRHVRLTHEPPVSGFPAHQLSEDAIFAEVTATTTTTGAETTGSVSMTPSQRRDDEPNDKGHAQMTETALPESHPSEAILQQSPNAFQPHKHFFSTESFPIRDLDESDELDRLLGLQPQPHEADILRSGDEREAEVDEANGGEVCADVSQGATPPTLKSHAEVTNPSHERLQIMSPGTLSTLHHLSRSYEGSLPSKTYSQRGGSSFPGSCSPSTAARPLDLPTSPSSNGCGSLGENEYLLHHQSRPPIIGIHVRHNRAATGSASEFRLGLGGTPSEGYGCMTAASNGLGSGGLDSRRGISTGFGREDRSLTEDLPWALGRQEDTTSSEIACQLFSGLGASRAGARGEGRFYMSGMGVGIGTTIGGRNSPGTGGTIYRGRTQSVQTIELSDQTEQYLFSEEQAYYPSVSHDTEERLQQQQLGEATSESDCGGMDSPEDGFSIRVGEYDEQEEADELKELGLYSDHSSDRGSPIEEFGGDDYSNDEDVSYGELQEDHDVAVDQLGGQSSDDSDYSDESNYDTEDMNHEEGHDYIDEFEEVEGRQGQMCDDGLTRSLSSSQASTISERLQPN